MNTSGHRDVAGAEPASEREIVATFAEVFRAGAHVQHGIGDDAAVLAPHGGVTLVSTDMLVEGVDFDRNWASLADVAWKSIAVNVSDIGAMGATPTSLVIALGLPHGVSSREVALFGRAAQDAVEELAPGASIVGGDLSRAPVLTVSVTALGVLVGGEPVLRSGATPGDVVAYCGDLGLAAAGLAFVQRGGENGALPRSEAVERAVQAQLRPRPPVASGNVARLAGATSLIDVSDGLAVDAARIADASGVSISFDQTAFPRLVSGLGWARVELGLDPWALVFAGGEDFGLLATFPAEADVPDGFVVLGSVLPRGEFSVTMRDRPLDYPQWDHFGR